MVYRFGPFELDLASFQLSRDGVSAALPPKVLDLLALFASHPGELLTKDAIFDALWPGTAVTDNAITQVVSAAREALGDDAAHPTFIQTVPRRGYRFIAELRQGPARDPAAALPARAGRRLCVSNFINLSGAEAPDWLGAGIAETLTNDLRGVPDLLLVDRVAAPADVRAGHVPAATAAGLDLLVVGSYQASGGRIRVSGRVIETRTSTAIAQAKADGPLSDIFTLQDTVVAALLQAMYVQTPGPVTSRARRDTPHLDAYEALTMGRLKLDSLDPDLAPQAIDDFTRAVTIDPSYALAWVGLAHAHFWLHERSRLEAGADASHLSAAVAHADRAISIDPELAEAHAARAMFLAQSARGDDALRAGREAVRLEPNDWRHRFRLALAAWGEERLTSVEQVHQWYPDFTPAYFVAAMVHVARSDIASARRALELGREYARQAGDRHLRFPANGLFWLSGLLQLADHDIEGAWASFEAEGAQRARGLYADEYVMNVANARGFVSLRRGDAEAAARWFEQSLARAPGQPRALTGVGDALRRLGRRADAEQALTRARTAIDTLRAADRSTDAAMALAQWQVTMNRPEEALQTIDALLTNAPPGMAGWTLPVEPWLASLRGTPMLDALLTRLANRAR